MLLLKSQEKVATRIVYTEKGNGELSLVDFIFVFYKNILVSAEISSAGETTFTAADYAV